MIIRERAIDAGALGGAACLVVAAWWLAGQMQDHPAVIPVARPAPTVTVTNAAPPVVVGRTVAPSPTAEPRDSAGGSVLAARISAQASDGSEPGSGGSGGGSSRPSQPPTSGSSGVSVSLQRPLGLLPDVDLTIGGSK